MFQLPAVLVNCQDKAQVDVRTVLTELGVRVTDSFLKPEDVTRLWPTPPEGPRIIVARIQGLRQTEATAKLSDGFPGWPLIAMVDGSPDPVGLYRVSRAGAAQLLPFPFQPDDLRQALDRICIQFGVRVAAPRVIAVSPASPGSGATVLAVNLANEIANVYGLATVLTELEFGLGRLAGALDLSPPITTRELLTDPTPPTLVTLLAAMIPLGLRLSVLAGPYRGAESFRPSTGQVAHLLGLMRRAGTVTVVDLPGSFDATFFEAASAADRVILVGRQDVPTIEAMKLTREALSKHTLPDPMLVLNAYEKENETLSTDRVGQVLGLSVTKVACDTNSARRAANEAKMLAQVARHSPAVADIRRLAEKLLKELNLPVTPKPKASFWSRLFTRQS